MSDTSEHGRCASAHRQAMLQCKLSPVPCLSPSTATCTQYTCMRSNSCCTACNKPHNSNRGAPQASLHLHIAVCTSGSPVCCASNAATTSLAASSPQSSLLVQRNGGCYSAQCSTARRSEVRSAAECDSWNCTLRACICTEAECLDLHALGNIEPSFMLLHAASRVLQATHV